MKRNSILSNQEGAVAIIVAVMLIVLLGIAALAIDLGHLAIVRNQVQNAADAGALAGAHVLYASISGSVVTVNTTTVTAVATAATTTNTSDGSAVEVLSVNIERGHWCFSCTAPDGTAGVFTPSAAASFTMPPLNFSILDTSTSYINAVRVTASRGPVIQASSFFAKIFGFTGFTVNAQAIAWVGFAGSNVPVSQPIAICQESVFTNGTLDCTSGRTMDNFSTVAAWTTFDEESDACNTAGIGASKIIPLVDAGCTSGTIPGISITAGLPMTAVNGLQQSVFQELYNCWKGNKTLDTYPSPGGDGIPDEPWHIKLAMILCGGSPAPCSILQGGVEMDVFWITDNGADSNFSYVSTKKSGIPKVFDTDTTKPGYEYSCTAGSSNSKTDVAARQTCWYNFLKSYNVKDASGNPLTVATAANLYQPNVIYFKPSCSLYMATAGSTGTPSDIIATIPRLVK